MFQLYHTLDKKLRAKPLTAREKALMNEISLTFSKEEIESFVMLIFEHYRITTNKNIEACNLPFDLAYDETSKELSLDLKTFPQPLQHILFKFCKLIKNKTQ